MVDQPNRNRRIVRRVILALVALPIFLASYVVSLPYIVYLQASGSIEIDGATEKVLELYYAPLASYSSSDLPGGRALQKWIRVAGENGKDRRRISTE